MSHFNVLCPVRLMSYTRLSSGNYQLPSHWFVLPGVGWNLGLGTQDLPHRNQVLKSFGPTLWLYQAFVCACVYAHVLYLCVCVCACIVYVRVCMCMYCICACACIVYGSGGGNSFIVVTIVVNCKDTIIPKYQ